MVENESLWQAAARCHEVLAAAEIPHAVLGGVAVCLHGYQRNAVDVDILVRRVDSDAVRVSLNREGFAPALPLRSKHRMNLACNIAALQCRDELGFIGI